uniref:hypothetical protein n=1 Tax=Bartonella sp. AP9QHHD TaxID=3243507 RepID=UPI0035D0726B
MKKLYAPQAASELKRSRFSFVKVLSLAIAATFLSNVTPVFSANPDFRNTFLEGVKSAGVSYPQSLLSVAGLNASPVSKNNYLTALNKAGLEKINASDDYANFLTRTLTSVGDDNSIANTLKIDDNKLSKNTLSPEDQNKKFVVDPQFFMDSSSVTRSFTQSGQDTVTIDASDFSRKDPIARMTRSGEVQRDVSGSNVIFGEGVNAKTVDSVVIGSKAKAVLAERDQTLAASVIIGSNSEIHRGGSVAVGADIVALNNDAVAVGRFIRVEADSSTALGFKTQVKVVGGVAIGSDSVANRAAGEFGYTSVLQGPATSSQTQWKSTRGAVSVGDRSNGITRQITGVAAGSEPADAVNVRQLRDLEDVVRKTGWKLSVGDKNATAVLMDSGVDFSAGSSNLNITKGDKDNKLKFDLAKDITLSSAKVAGNTLDATGLVISGGPKITTSGIDAGSKKITGIQNGALTAESTEAVNGSQLLATNTEINEVRDSILVKQVAEMALTRSLRDGGTGLITIGKGTGGTEISILNKDNGGRKLSGLLGGTINENSDEAVSGSQLHTLGSSVASYFGGGAKYESGAWTAPTFKLKTFTADGKEGASKDYPDVGSAFAGIDTNFINVNKHLNTVVNNFNDKLNDINKEFQGDALLWSKTDKAFSAMHVEGEDRRSGKIKYLGGGDLTQNSEEAVNGGQLYTLGTHLANYLGGGADFGNGNSEGPTFKVKTFRDDGTEDKQSYRNVADAFEGVNTALTTVQNKLTEQVNNVITKVESESFVQQDKTTHRLTIGAKVGGAEINIANESGADRIISGVGEAKNNNDAVNKSQLDKGLKDLSTSLQSDDSAVVHYDKTGDETDYTSVTLGKGKDKAAVGLHNVADGQIAKGSHDAITGGQINKIGEDVAKFLGGEASFKDGALTQPTYKLSYIAKDGVVTESDFQGVGTAFSGLDTNIKNVNARIKEVSEGVAQDSLLWSKEADAFVARHEKSKEEKGKAVRTQENSRITFLANGEISAKSTDAVTGSQLYSLNEQLATYFGGGAGYDKEGKWKAPDFKIKQFGEDGTSFDKNYTNVADALAGVGSSITNVQNKLTEQVNNVITKVENESFVQQDKTTHRLTIGAKVGGAEINIANESGGDRIISGVGEAKNNNDAVNKSQLDSNIKNVNDNVTNKFSELTKNITNITQQVKGDALLWNDKANAFVARHEKKQEEKGKAVRTQENSRITFLANGEISANSTDAITGGQLYSLNEQLATYFGGGAGYDEQGQWTAPSFKVKTVKDDGKSEEIDYGNVADALAGVGNSFINIRNEISKEINNEITNVKGDSLVKKDQATNLITIGKEVEGSEINIANKTGTDRTLSGVGEATKDNEAVNKGQLDKGLKDLSTSLQSDDSAVVHYDKKEGENGGIDYTSVTLGKGKDKAAVGLHNVADGQIAKGSRDAITGGQINKIGEDVAKFLGGEASFKDGALTQPTYKLSYIAKDGVVTESAFQGVGTAFAGLDENIKNVNARIKEVSEGVAQDSLLWSKEADAFVARHEKSKEEKGRAVRTQENSRITFLANGEISAKSTDAVTGS